MLAPSGTRRPYRSAGGMGRLRYANAGNPQAGFDNRRRAMMIQGWGEAIKEPQCPLIGAVHVCADMRDIGCICVTFGK